MKKAPKFVENKGLGRISKLTPERQERICAALRAGNTRRAAAQFSGIEESTLAEWMARGEGRDPDRIQTELHAEFARAVKRAEAESEQALIATIRNASEKQWQAAAWIAERRFPESWAAVEKRAEAQALAAQAQAQSTEQSLEAVLAQLPAHVLEAALKRHGGKNAD